MGRWYWRAGDQCACMYVALRRRMTTSKHPFCIASNILFVLMRFQSRLVHPAYTTGVICDTWRSSALPHFRRRWQYLVSPCDTVQRQRAQRTRWIVKTPLFIGRRAGRLKHCRVAYEWSLLGTGPAAVEGLVQLDRFCLRSVRTLKAYRVHHDAVLGR